jgi:hypothetical protein
MTPPMVRTLLRNRLKTKAYIIGSETNDVDWIIRIRLCKVNNMIERLNNPHRSREREGLLCHRVISNLLDTVALCGHKDFVASFVRDVSIDNETHYIVDTQGCNLLDLSSVPCIDWFNTTSNDVTEVHNILGIEAASSVLYHELNVTISFDGTYVDPRHIMMIVNTMTRGGYIMPLSRHGINRMDTGPLLRCSFEETPDILCDAACFGEVDNGKGVSQNIMTGKLASIGSGLPELVMHSSMLHPREISLVAKIGKKVLKSYVRMRPIAPTQTHLIEIDKNHNQNIDETFRLPFDSTNLSRTTTEPEKSIFSSMEMQAPFQDVMDVDLAYNTSGSITKTKPIYVPSSPVSD